MENTFDHRAATWDENPRRLELVKRITHAIQPQLNLNSNTKLLDYGCGTGLLGFSLINQVQNITFCDTSAGMLEQVKLKASQFDHLNTQISMVDLCEKPFETTFDVAVSMLVLHHVEQLKTLFMHLNQSLNNEGLFCWIDLDEEDGSFHGEIEVPHNGFKEQDIRNLFEENGFKIEFYSKEITMKKEVENRIREFPIFIAIGKKQ